MTVLLEDVLDILSQEVTVAPKIRLPLEECWGRVLAEDIISDMDFPPFNRSPLDGYAVRSTDISRASLGNPVFLRQIDYVPAGTVPSKRVGTGEATRIMTGAPIPEGADAVVRLEDTINKEGQIGICYPDMAARNICSKGEEFKVGEVVLRRGIQLNEGSLALLAMLGRQSPLVYHKPEVAILATGSELVGASEELREGKIRDSNSYMLLAKVLRAGGQPVLLGHVKDDLGLITEKIHSKPGLSVYITTGGASVGDCDLMEGLFNKLNIPILFKRVAIKPGMPVIAGKWKDSLVIALSGNPAAGSVSFEVLVRPILRKMAGFVDYQHTRIKVRLADGFKKASPGRRFVWARCFFDEGTVYAQPLNYQGNGMLRSTVEANALLDIPAGSPALEIGTELDALLM